MNKPSICVSITVNDPDSLHKIEKEVDLFELRIDMLGNDWRSVAKDLNKPWIACNRSPDEGGRGDVNPAKRLETLFDASGLGASIIDLEYNTADLAEKVQQVKHRSLCLLSSHNLRITPSLDVLTRIVEGQIKAGADICKVVTTATKFDDNITVLRLVKQFSGIKISAFAMGELGRVSRILSPLCGGYFTYASPEEGREAAVGQISVNEMRQIYSCLKT
jgi:3-dehydroquinate dehydratase I